MIRKKLLLLPLLYSFTLSGCFVNNLKEDINKKNISNVNIELEEQKNEYIDIANYFDDWGELLDVVENLLKRLKESGE